MSPENDVHADSIARAARALLTVLASEGIDIPETRLLAKALGEAWQAPVARLTAEMAERVAQYPNRSGRIVAVAANGTMYYGSAE